MRLVTSAVFATGIGLLSASASAAPVGSNGLQSALPNTGVENVQYGPRRCWRRYDGALVCRHVVRRHYYRDRYYDPYYGPGYGYGLGYGYGPGYYGGPGVGVYGPGVGLRFGW